MAKKETKSNTGALDVGAMYQIGAAGAGSKAKASTEGLGLLKEIGRYAVGFKLQTIENLKAAVNLDNQVFANFNDKILEHDLDLNDQTLETVTNIKNRVTDANKVLHGMKYSWRPDSPEYKAANESKSNALLELKKLQEKNLQMSTIFKENLEITRGESFVKGADGREYQVRLFGTEEEKWWSSLLANGSVSKAREWDGKLGEYVINMEIIGDNLDTKNIDESKLKKIPFSKIGFATPSNAAQTDPASKVIEAFIGWGQGGDNKALTSSSREQLFSDFDSEIGKLGNRHFAQLLEEGTIVVNGETMSYLDAMIKDKLPAINTIGNKDWDLDDEVDNPSYISESETPGVSKTIKESELYELAIIGAKETIKETIVNAPPQGSEEVSSYKNQMKDLVKNNAEDRYEEELEAAEERKNKKESETKNKSRRYYRTELAKIKKIVESGSGDYIAGGVTWKLSTHPTLGGVWTAHKNNVGVADSSINTAEFVEKFMSQEYYQYMEKRKDRYSWAFPPID